MNAAHVVAVVLASASLSCSSAAARDTKLALDEVVTGRPSLLDRKPAASTAPLFPTVTPATKDRLQAGFSVRGIARHRVSSQSPSIPDGHASETLLQDSSSHLQPSLTSQVVIPGWMRGGEKIRSEVEPTGVDCNAGPYRPSGFLEATAEIRRARFFPLMRSAACRYDIPVELFDAMIMRESRYEATAASPKKAYGLTQLLSTTAIEMGVDRFNVAQNLHGGARYLRRQLDRFGEVHLALAAYNAGPGRVRGRSMPQIAETIAYVDNVLATWRRLSRGSSRLAAGKAVPAEGTAKPSAHRRVVVFLF